MDDAAFDAFYNTCVRRLVSQLFLMIGDLAEAEDCVQEAFVKAWLHRGKLDGNENPQAWVRKVAWRNAVSRWRRSSATLRAYRRHGVAADAGEPQLENTELTDALRALPLDQRRAVVLHYLCDLSVAAIAIETGAKPGTVRVRLSRGRAALAQQLGKQVDTDLTAAQFQSSAGHFGRVEGGSS